MCIFDLCILFPLKCLSNVMHDFLYNKNSMASNRSFSNECNIIILLKDILDRRGERVLAEIVYSILFAIYGIILIVWYTMYDEISYINFILFIFEFLFYGRALYKCIDH